MTTQYFDYDFLEAIYRLDQDTPENVKVVDAKHINRGMITQSNVVFKLVDEWRFFRMHVDNNVLRDSLSFRDATTGEWSDEEGAECVEVEPHIKQIVIYEDI